MKNSKLICCLENAIGVDLYNQCLPGGVSKTLSSKATDADHIPCVIIKDNKEKNK